MFYGRTFYLNTITNQLTFDFDSEIRKTKGNHLDKVQRYTENYNILFDILTKTEPTIGKFINDFKFWSERHP